MSTDHNVWRERRAEADSNRGPSGYQPNAFTARPNRLTNHPKPWPCPFETDAYALPLGHTGSPITPNLGLVLLRRTRPSARGWDGPLQRYDHNCSVCQRHQTVPLSTYRGWALWRPRERGWNWRAVRSRCLSRSAKPLFVAMVMCVKELLGLLADEFLCPG